MRLPEAQIKQGLLHEDASVRDAAMTYFAESFSPDAEVMPLVIQAIERYGPQEAYYTTYAIPNLVQTEATIGWAIRELKRTDLPQTKHYFAMLGQLIGEADPTLLLPRREEILGLSRLDKEAVEAVQEQLEFQSWDADRCWRELEEIARQGIADRNWDLDYGRASRIVQALARQGEGYADRAIELLSRTVEDFENDPLAIQEIFLTELVGRMRLEAAAPILVQRIKESEASDYVWDGTQYALARIASPATVPLVTEGWQDAKWEFKLFGSAVLGWIHTDAIVERGLRLLALEDADDLRSWLVLALLDQFAPETIDPICQVIREESYDPHVADLKRQVTAVAALLDISTPELKQWKGEADREHRKMLEKMRKYERDNFFASLPPHTPAHEPSSLAYNQTPIVSTKKHVGRNEPCPCGSGKKFKNCCINKA